MARYLNIINSLVYNHLSREWTLWLHSSPQIKEWTLDGWTTKKGLINCKFYKWLDSSMNVCSNTYTPNGHFMTLYTYTKQRVFHIDLLISLMWKQLEQRIHQYWASTAHTYSAAPNGYPAIAELNRAIMHMIVKCTSIQTSRGCPKKSRMG